METNEEIQDINIILENVTKYCENQTNKNEKINCETHAKLFHVLNQKILKLEKKINNDDYKIRKLNTKIDDMEGKLERSSRAFRKINKYYHS